MEQKYDGEFAHKVHALLEEKDDYEEVTGLRRRVEDFYNQLVEQTGESMGLSEEYLETAFEVYLEEGEYGLDEKVETVDRLVQGQEWSEVAEALGA